jgi:RsiW-degrading membrane proteinase PrsW (M82 family)
MNKSDILGYALIALFMFLCGSSLMRSAIYGISVEKRLSASILLIIGSFITTLANAFVLKLYIEKNTMTEIYIFSAIITFFWGVVIFAKIQKEQARLPIS